MKKGLYTHRVVVVGGMLGGVGMEVGLENA